MSVFERAAFKGDIPIELTEVSQGWTKQLITRLSAKGISFNIIKIKAIVLESRHNWIHAEGEELVFISVGDSDIAFHPRLKFLDNKLSWGTQIEHATNRTKAVLPPLHQICHNIFGYSTSVSQIYSFCTVILSGIIE